MSPPPPRHKLYTLNERRRKKSHLIGDLQGNHEHFNNALSVFSPVGDKQIVTKDPLQLPLSEACWEEEAQISTKHWNSVFCPAIPPHFLLFYISVKLAVASHDTVKC